MTENQQIRRKTLSFDSAITTKKKKKKQKNKEKNGKLLTFALSSTAAARGYPSNS